MRLRAHDDAFFAVPPSAAYRVLSDTAGYGSWWPGAASVGDGELLLPLGRRSTPARSSGHRRDLGLWLELPAYDGSLEWLLVPYDDGTVVNAYLDVDLAGASHSAGRRLLRMRVSVRRALVALKRSVEGA